jgi:hypothetical protein
MVVETNISVSKDARRNLQLLKIDLAQNSYSNVIEILYDMYQEKKEQDNPRYPDVQVPSPQAQCQCFVCNMNVPEDCSFTVADKHLCSNCYNKLQKQKEVKL